MRLVPHFEKMLYDQASYLRVLAKFGTIHPSPLVFDSIINSLDYLEREMLSDQKYFFSAQDADGEGLKDFASFSKEEFIDIINQDEDLENQQGKFYNGFKLKKKDILVISLMSSPSTRKKKIDTSIKREAWDLIRKVRSLLTRRT